MGLRDAADGGRKTMLDMIRAAGIFMIIAQTLYHFVSGSKYARYVRLLIRIMTLAVLIVPLLELVKTGTEADFYERLDQFEKEYEAILQNVEYTETSVVEERIGQTTARELKTMLDPVLAPYGYETVSVYADEGGLLFSLCRTGGGAGEIRVRPVREVSIQVGEPEDSENREQGGASGEEHTAADGQHAEESGGQQDESALADVIAAYLRVERSWVEVKIVG